MYVESFKELIVWQKSMELTKMVYSVTAEMPVSEQYGLTSQIRRSAVSIPSNIAEGYKRKSVGDYVHFLNIADASAAELETQLLLSQSIYTKIIFTKHLDLLSEVQKMLSVMIRKTKNLTNC